MDPITLEELAALLKGMASHKAPGPDNVLAETLQWLSKAKRQPLLDLFNNALLTGVIPQEWTTAVVHKADPNNYRPISLLSTSYKLFARILQKRLEGAIDSKLRSTHYGCGATRSTSQAIQVVRGLIESAERRGSTLYVQLLDWTSAFDKVHHQAVSQALSRHGVSPEFVKVVEAIYQCPTFTVRAAGKASQTSQAVFGGAQHDDCRCRRCAAAKRPDAALALQPEPVIQDLAYADDTAIFTGTAERGQQILHKIQEVAADSNLS